MPNGQPTFQGTAEEQKVAETIFDLMLMQGKAYSADAPIRQTLRNFTTYFLEQGLRPNQDEVASLVEAAVKANAQVFYRQESDGDVAYVTSRRGAAVRPLQAAIRHVPKPAVTVPPAAHGWAEAPAQVLRPVLKPILLKHEAPVVVEPRPVRREVRREPKAPAPVVKRPQVSTPEGQIIYMDAPAEEIVASHGPFFQAVVAEGLAADPRFVSFGSEWLLEDMLVDYTKGDVRRLRDAIEESGDVLADTALLEILEKSPDDDDYERARFSLNYTLMREKREFEFRGTNEERLWGLLGMVSPRSSRSALRPSEIGQDFKFLEDEPGASTEAVERWTHTLTYYEIENGVLPYSQTARRILPRPLLKEQRIALLEFAAPQLGLAVTAELHYPSGNRGGWVDGLEVILDSFVPGVQLLVEGTERENAFVLNCRRVDGVELETVRYDEKKGRFIFAPVTVDYQLDESMVVTKSRFKNLATAKRLEEGLRRKGDQVIGFAFTKVGSKEAGDGGKPSFRASLSDLLPVVNLEKPFSRASLLRFMTTHPHYRKDETDEEYYFYKPEE